MWKQILYDYDQRHCCNADEQIAWFGKQPSLRAAIKCAAGAIDERGCRYSHQYRIRRDSIGRATAALVAAERAIARAASFDDLLRVMTALLRDVSGIGELYRYDTTFRIGAYLGVFPARVYLHAGTRAGARALGLAYKKEALEISEVPAALRHRAPHEIEDILCIYKDAFRDGAVSATECIPRRHSSRRPRCCGQKRMREVEFADWLASVYRTRSGVLLATAAQRDALSRCHRVERHEGDLDIHYSRDRLRELLEKFSYSAEDAKRRIPPAHSVLIAGDIRDGTASMRSALVLYRKFLESVSMPR
jgi:hypothetical protein